MERFAPTQYSAAASTSRSKKITPADWRGFFIDNFNQKLLFVDCEVDSNGYRNRSTDHWVVTHTQEAHHLYVSRN